LRILTPITTIKTCKTSPGDNRHNRCPLYFQSLPDFDGFAGFAVSSRAGADDT
jgi:hypothetical protein